MSGAGKPSWRVVLLALGVVAAASHALTQAPHWIALAEDGIHDPTGPAIHMLQEPGVALAALPPDTGGNQVRWMQAIESGQIAPRASVLETGQLERLDTEVLMPRTGEMAIVKFPHRAHTMWLACQNCHDELFERKAGATRVNMALILNGDKCGLCHGAVAFPLTECNRCHSVARDIGPRPATPATPARGS